MCFCERKNLHSGVLVPEHVAAERTLTSGHCDERIWKIRLILVGSGVPLEHRSSRPVQQEIEYGEVDIELVLIFVLHAPSQIEEAYTRLAIALVTTRYGGR